MRRLALLQQQQQSTLSHLLNLRLEQLRLRQQQLGALQELLRAEAEAVEGTPMQLAAVHQALQLLSQSLEVRHVWEDYACLNQGHQTSSIAFAHEFEVVACSRCICSSTGSLTSSGHNHTV